MNVARLARPPSRFFTQPHGSSSPCRLHECTKRKVGGVASISGGAVGWIFLVMIGLVASAVFTLGVLAGLAMRDFAGLTVAAGAGCREPGFGVAGGIGGRLSTVVVGDFFRVGGRSTRGGVVTFWLASCVVAEG